MFSLQRQARDELEVASFLRARQVHVAAAQCWLSYRLTFLYQEDPIVVLAPARDR